MLNDENKYLFTFAWRSIRRNSGRSFFIGLSVSLAVVIAVWVVAFFDGLNYQIEKAVVNTNTGYFQIQEKEYARSTDSSQALPVSKEITSKLESLPVIAYSPELVLDSNISTPEGAAGLITLGVSPDHHKKFLPIFKKIIQGSFIDNESTSEVVIGNELAKVFKFSVGDQLILNYQDHSGELRSELLTIKGIFRYNSKNFERKYIYTNQKTWQRLFFNKVTEKLFFNRISLMTEGLKADPLISEAFEDSDLKVKSWKNLNPEMAVVLDFHDGMIKFFFIIIGITILMTILTPVRMLWQERYPELKMMNVLGVSVRKFWKIGVYEVLQMIMYSGLFSSLLLFIVIGIQSYTGIDFRFLNDGVSIERAGIKLPGIIYPRLSVDQILIVFVFVFFVLSFSYLWSINSTLKKLKVES